MKVKTKRHCLAAEGRGRQSPRSDGTWPSGSATKSQRKPAARTPVRHDPAVWSLLAPHEAHAPSDSAVLRSRVLLLKNGRRSEGPGALTRYRWHDIDDTATDDPASPPPYTCTSSRKSEAARAYVQRLGGLVRGLSGPMYAHQTQPSRLLGAQPSPSLCPPQVLAEEHLQLSGMRLPPLTIRIGVGVQL